MSVNANSHRRRLPQPIHKRQRINNADKIKPLSPVIIFDYVGEYTQGVVMIDINNRSPAVLGAKMVGAFDQAFAHPLPSASFTLRIKRPGYDHFDFNLAVNLPKPLRVHVFSPDFVKLTGTSKNYQVGLIDIQRLVLVGLHNIYGNVWQAEVDIDMNAMTF
ncbi:hypothetical protein CC1G_08060 [Coprinopsis cinerea okayama7|uniref:Uncharacterized protein n=1 Tax=Coprinopsis cinerea (strain Okayama-7 / 130 / ATCC MYA-4618 / FGSC 9003) TaxID=240176 RepID=A8NVK9_COPC7|nr:hypothetical protein CC1G_08060 [Coprinopsis cinerea okayama7\|eukprot:XP_001836675.1 hypothetical protein CC1G_08060 [Coprinopsis cinerea okayama7\